jgi:hypothetical protein
LLQFAAVHNFLRFVCGDNSALRAGWVALGMFIRYLEHLGVTIGLFAPARIPYLGDAREKKRSAGSYDISWRGDATKM